MDNSNRKFLTMSYLAAGFLVALTTRVLLETLAGSFGAVAKVYNTDLVAHGVPVLLGLTTFFVLQFNRKVGVWADEVVTEIRKIVWPSRRDVTAMTAVCCVMLIISGIVLWVFDNLSNTLVKLVMQLGS